MFLNTLYCIVLALLGHTPFDVIVSLCHQLMSLAALFPIFRLSGDLSIQMVTALVLQLIQCSVKIPEKTDEIQDEGDAEDGMDENKPHVSFINIA